MNQMNIHEIEEEVVSAFDMLDDWMDKYNYLIELGRDLPEIDAQYKTDNNLIRGCQARVWLHAGYAEGKVYLSADSDALITKGIVALLVRVLSGQTAADILAADMGFIDKIGLREHLSQTRSNGLNQMIKQIKLYALAFQAGEKH